MKLRIEYDDRDVRDALMRLERAAEDLEPAMADIAAHLEDSVRESFEAEAAPDGTPWKPLADSTRRGRERQGYGGPGPILERSGDLAARIIADWDNTRAEVGSNQEFSDDVLAAAVHHFGTRDGHVPARPFFGVTDEHRDAILATIRDHLERSL